MLSNYEILDANSKKPMGKPQRDISSLVPPLVVNPAQKHFMKFWFGTENADKIIQNRQQIYNGQLNAQCPNFDDPDATIPYINFATQKMECRVPNPKRPETLVDGAAKQCLNGPNPFAIEKYIRADGTAVCRVPVARGKWFCHEPPKDPSPEEKKKYDQLPNAYKGEHMTLPDGTGICIPPPGVNPHAPPKREEDFRTKYSIFGKLFTDRIVQIPTPSDVKNSVYYSLFQKNRFNEGQITMMLEAIKAGRKDGKQKIIDYLSAVNDPMQGLFTGAIKALYEDTMPDVIYRYHRDLYYYLKENYPNYFQGTIPKEERMRFLGYEGANLFA
jgi:hypothetical protein